MIRKKKQGGKQIIDLTGPQGNAFYLLGTAGRLALDLGFDNKDEILAEMKSSNYENLVTLFDNYFGDFVILER